MVLEVRTIELRVVNATNLKKVKKFKQQRCYVVAYIYPAQRQATLVDTSGGVNPTWDASVSLNCYETDLQPADGSSGDQWPPSTTSSSTKSITIDIYSHTGGFFTRGDKVVGTVKVPLNQIASVTRIAGLSLMSFDVYRPSGKAQGKLNLIVKLGEKRAITESEQQPPSYAYYDTKVAQAPSPMMPPMTTSYSTASSALFTDCLRSKFEHLRQPKCSNWIPSSKLRILSFGQGGTTRWSNSASSKHSPAEAIRRQAAC